MSKNKAVAWGVAMVVAFIAFATACSKDSKVTEPFKDAPRSGIDTNVPMNVINGADGFSNIGWQCVGKDGVYRAFHGDSPYASIFIATNDPNCLPGAVIK